MESNASFLLDEIVPEVISCGKQSNLAIDEESLAQNSSLKKDDTKNPFFDEIAYFSSSTPQAQQVSEASTPENIFGVEKKSTSGSGSTPGFGTPTLSPDPVRSRLPGIDPIRPADVIDDDINIDKRDAFDQLVDSTTSAIEFYESIVLEGKTLDVIMIAVEDGKFKSVGFCVKSLFRCLDVSDTGELEELNRTIRFFYEYFEVKIVQNPPKIIQLCLAKTGKGIFADFDAMINGYRLLTRSALSLDDLLDYDLKNSSILNPTESPKNLLKWFVCSVVHATFSLVFFHYLLMMHRMKSLDYFADESKIDDYNNHTVQFKSQAFRSLNDLFDHCRKDKQKNILATTNFQLSIRKYFKGFFKVCDLMDTVGHYFSKLYDLYKDEMFFLDGFSGIFQL